ncbi:MAG: AbrB/MazE/SpoVT family DNA-binding domain-containing protein [bacterium]
MEKTVATVKGQVVIPARLRRKFGIKKGAKFLVEERDGAIVLTPINRAFYMRFAGMLKDGQSWAEYKKEMKAEEEAHNRKPCALVKSK